MVVDSSNAQEWIEMLTKENERLHAKLEKIEDIYYHQTGKALENSLREVIEYGNVD